MHRQLLLVILLSMTTSCFADDSKHADTGNVSSAESVESPGLETDTLGSSSAEPQVSEQVTTPTSQPLERDNTLVNQVMSRITDGAQATPERELKLFNERAAGGDSEAMYFAGILYGVGHGLTSKQETDHRWEYAFENFKKAAELGNAEAQAAAGWCYDHALGIDWSPSQAVRWYAAAADQGSTNALCYQGLVEEDRNSDIKAATSYYVAAAQKGNAFGEYALGLNLSRQGQQKEAEAHFKVAAAAGSDAAQFYLGLSYIYGDGPTRDVKNGLTLLETAANQNNVNAQFMLGKALLNAEFGRKDAISAYRWYLIAISQDYSLAAANLLEAGASLDHAQKLACETEAKTFLGNYVKNFRAQAAPFPAIPLPISKQHGYSFNTPHASSYYWTRGTGIISHDVFESH